MIDYSALRAIEAVIEFQSFATAAKSLFISQSAVSQRINNIEAYIGERLLIRKQPYRATEKGKEYLSLLRKVSSLEQGLLRDKNDLSTLPTIKLAINRDSLELWFYRVLQDSKLMQNLNFEIIADDQDLTLNFLKSGLVDLCISSEKNSIPNFSSIFIGKMEYRLVCAKDFYQKYFKGKENENAYLEAPAVIFDKNDETLNEVLSKVFKLTKNHSLNLIPSVQGFKNSILAGAGYGLLPLMDIKNELQNKRLIELNKKARLNIPLYLHHWNYQTKNSKQLVQKIEKVARYIT